jgi:CRISPR-associated endonuclease/helicase Cas3
VFTPASAPVTLAAHQNAVADRARLLADQAGLARDLAEALSVAGAHHDDGKADPRFQSFRLRAPACGEPLAKSLPGATALQAREQQGQAGLPAGWRHEQRSVADCWEAVHAWRAAVYCDACEALDGLCDACAAGLARARAYLALSRASR